MKIISKFHDYYDAASNVGIDETIIYLREEKEVKTPKPFDHVKTDWHSPSIFGGVFNLKKAKKQYWRSSKSDGIRKWHLIGFCGKIYVCLEEVIYGSEQWAEIKREEVVNFYFGLDCLIPFEGQTDDTGWYNYARKSNTYLNTKNFIEEMHGKDNNLFFQFESPIFVINDYHAKENKTIVNPNLKKLAFFKVKDTYTAFQEIQEFISGVLGINREPIAIQSDKDKILAHGFDNKWSFRNPDAPLRKQKK